ncbi:CTP synthase [Neocallimastix californiae]|uniref:CTP synthase n=1 Tax=Neocallimastix californiae TaxID=1754190 RepID=A0A1Y2FTC1_9FUNG|nr:CTP synthase [Neocallimastix californiae]|eukprot:ORY87260.1 CTP synthase [Neocallimastix californiae]
MKYILVTGGVISGIGKGVIASSTGFLMKTLGLRVTSIKIDPYLNIDAGTLSPLDHGEVFVLDDGGEVDLDLGNYERFLDVRLGRDNNITTGKIYREVIERERRGDYLGKTVQVVPHITNAIQNWIERVAKKPVDDSNEEPDICIIELGGTVGDIESAPFIEAMRQFQFRVGFENFFLIHVSLVPVVGSVGEQKTKPTQSSVRDLRGLGLSPDMIACRSTKPLDIEIKNKISMFCHVKPDHVVGVHDCNSLYHVPLLLHSQGVVDIIREKLNIAPNVDPTKGNLFRKWVELTKRHDRLQDTTTIVLVGKYTNLQDSYISVSKALHHAAMACNRKLIINWVEATDLEEETCATDPIKYHESWKKLCTADGILVPGGFGERGVEGKIAAIKRAREFNIPFLGICLGLQLASIEFARNVCGIENAHSDELKTEGTTPLVIFMPEGSKTQMGGTMRLGSRVTNFVKDYDSIAKKLYGGRESISERHRHRYEVNPKYVPELEKHGLRFVGRDETGERMEILELEGHPYFVASQFHPEYKTRPLNPSPLFLGLILAASGLLETYFESLELPEKNRGNLGRYRSFTEISEISSLTELNPLSQQTPVDAPTTDEH